MFHPSKLVQFKDQFYQNLYSYLFPALLSYYDACKTAFHFLQMFDTKQSHKNFLLKNHFLVVAVYCVYKCASVLAIGA